LISFVTVFSTLETLLKCKECNGDIKFLRNSPRGFKLTVKYSCREYKIDSCPIIKNAYEVNRRFTFIMRLLGVGHAGINLFCSLMDINTYHKSLYQSVVEQISIAVKSEVNSDAERTAATNSKEARIFRRAMKAAENDLFEETEGLLYAPGIAN